MLPVSLCKARAYIVLIIIFMMMMIIIIVINIIIINIVIIQGSKLTLYNVLIADKIEMAIL